MKILTSPVTFSSTIKKSKFLCFGFFVQNKDDVKDKIDNLKKQFPDASHICYAYILDDKNYYFTDGGEPSGTAGKPIYGAILSKNLNYTLLVIIRYFGGIKFGPGPLRSTFKDLAIQTLGIAKTKDSEIKDIVQIRIPYSLLKAVTKIFNKSIYQKSFSKEYILIDIVGTEKQILSTLTSLNIQPYKIIKNQII